MDHNDTVQAEFTRQAEAFRASPTLSAAEVTARVGEALGPQCGRVLDIACGPGLLLPTLADHAQSVIGLDLTAKNLRLAQAAETSGPVHLVRALAESLPFFGAAFDAVVLRLTLHHLVDPALVLQGARSLLRPGGRIVVLDVLGPDASETALLRDSIERLRDPSHTSLLSSGAMLSALEAAGFLLLEEALWSQARVYSDWAAIMNEPARMADLEAVLRAFSRAETDPTGLDLRDEDGELRFTYDWGLFVGQVPG